MSDSPVYYTTLREANTARQKEWDANDVITAAFRGNELAGELGEALEQAVGLLQLAITVGRACNIVKKIEREQLGIRGSRATKEELARELADVMICTDLIAMQAGIDLDQAVRDTFNATSFKMGLNTRLTDEQRQR